MKKEFSMKTILLTLVFLTTLLFGQGMNSIDQQIEAIQKAPAKQRVQMMNEFKKKLMQMNQEQRMAAISKMRSKMAAHSMQHANNQHIETMQMDAMDKMPHIQNMNQHQAGDQFKHQQESNPSTGDTHIIMGGGHKMR